MIGAVSLNPYVSSYQYTGSRVRAAERNMQGHAAQNVQRHAVQSTSAHAAQKTSGHAVQSTSAHAAQSVPGQAVQSMNSGAAGGTRVVPVLQQGNSGGDGNTIPFLRKGMDPAELSVRMRIQYDGAGISGQLPGERSQAVSRGVSEAVQLDLPGTHVDEAEQMGLPGTATGKAAEAGLPGVSSGAETGLPGVSSEAETQNAGSGKEAPEVAGLHAEGAEKATEETECKTCKERKYQDGSDDPGVSFKTPGHIDPGQSAAVVRGHEMEHVVNERAKAKNEGRRVISQTVSMQTGVCPECGRVYTAGGVTRTTTAAETKPAEQQKDPRQILAASA